VNGDRLPPQNRSAERAVLGSVLRWPEALADVAEVLRPEDFYADAHQKIFAAMARLADGSKPVDLVTVTEELRRSGHGQDAPPVYLAELWDECEVGSNVAYHAGLVKDASQARELIHVATEILRDAYTPVGPAAEQLEAAERAIFAIADKGSSGNVVELHDALGDAVHRVEQAATGHLKEGGIPTGFIDLDGLTNGLHPGELTIVGARPGVGKSALGLSLLRNAAAAGVGGLFVSLEMSAAELGERVLAAQSGLDSRRLRKGRLSGEEEWSRVADARYAFRTPKVFIDDAPGQRMFHVAATARRLKLKHCIGLVVLDYVQLVEPEDRRVQRYEQVAAVSRRLKLLARELALPVVAMAQVGRGAEEHKRPRLSDLRESGDLEANADNVLLLHRNDDREGAVEVIVAKQRNGPTGAITLAWIPGCMRFENYATESYTYADRANF
jgi:replicative DNA helicase